MCELTKMEGMAPWESSKNALENVLEAVAGEKIVILCDEEKIEVGRAFAAGAIALGLWARMIVLKTDRTPRTEIPERLLEVFSCKPDLYLNLFRESLEETPFRIRVIKMETRGRARLGHCPGVTLEMLSDGALALTPEEHKNLQEKAEKLIATLQGTLKVEIRNSAGTNLALSTKNRPFFTDTKIDWKSLKWMNLPTGEVLVAPVENSLNGKIVVDMAIGGIGKLRKPLEVFVKDGRAMSVFSKDKETLRRVEETFGNDEWSNVVGEFAFGINSKARFVDEFLESEKTLGTVHVAFGSNTDMPKGKNRSRNHIDLLLSSPTVTVTKEDGSVFRVLNEGQFQI
ncbi:aminopeptidase [Candidatus Bathyarchaeota archaeon]|nr:aminopeptidase [Candidatus Bathyarchaeota archaeon]